MNLIDIAKIIKDKEAKSILEHPEDFPDGWIKNAEYRLLGSQMSDEDECE